jgi:polygalacturonase
MPFLPVRAIPGALPVLALLFATGCSAAADSSESGTDEAVTSSDGGARSDSGTKSDAGLAMSCDIRDYGAKADGKTVSTKAIQAAIDACAGHGGEVHIQDGTYLSGTIVLKANMTFHVHGGGILRGVAVPDLNGNGLPDANEVEPYYPDLKPWQWTSNSQISNTQRALVFAHGATNLHITGTGIIDGDGEAAIWQGPPGSKIVETLRPSAMYLLQSDHVTVDGITLENSAMWTMVNMELTNLAISGITIDSEHGRTLDGIDILDCQHVKVDSVTVTSEDDALCIKSGLPIGVDDVTFSNSKVVKSEVANALKIGTASYGPITNVTYENITVGSAGKAAMAVEAIDGSNIKNVTFKSITFASAGTPFFVVTGDRADKPAADPDIVGSIDGLTFANITGTSTTAGWGSTFSGMEENGKTSLVSNVSFTNVNVSFLADAKLTSVPAIPIEYDSSTAARAIYPDPGTLFGDVPAWGLFFRHVRNVSFLDTVFTLAGTDVRPMLSGDDVADVGAVSTVTFVVHTAAGAPALELSEATLAITGATTEPTYALAPSDPLGNWTHAGPAVALAPSKSDPTTYSGTAIIPQGATLAYKTIATENGKTTYERSSAGNRAATIPATSATTIEIDWQN